MRSIPKFMPDDAICSSETQDPFLPLFGKGSPIKGIIEQAKIAAKSHAHIFIHGESGTGKEVVANYIHAHSFRSKEPFIKVNCAAIPDTLIESEFFGHEKGSFTGAHQMRMGRFELADKGTLLLDEVSEIPLSLQPKLLRIIQEKEFERVGSNSPKKVDVRLISTSNRDMKEEMLDKRFREDLFFRLHVIPFYLPPLRERKGDILPLASFFLMKFAKENGKLCRLLSKKAEEKLQDYGWPGNIRELANLMERLSIMGSDPLIEEEEILQDTTSLTPIDKPLSLYEVEKKHILAMLHLCKLNKTKTAEVLGITVKTLRSKLSTPE